MFVNHQTLSVILFIFYKVGFASPISMRRDGEINVLRPLFGMFTLPRCWRRRTGVGIFRLRNFNVRKDRQGTYNRILWSFRVTTVAVEDQKVLHILSVCVYVCVCVCVCVALGIQYVMWTHHSIICGLHGSTIFLHNIS